jgi:Cu(I)/Ag(I) efflux system membrane fusion protein
MVEGYNRWLQPSAEIDNPYMGSRMPRCGSEVPWSEVAPAAGGGDIAYYTCPMHPSVRQEGPGTCPLCSMDLVPVTRHELETGVIRVDSARRQEIGVRTAPVERRGLTRTVHAVGRVVVDETQLTDVVLKVDGYVGRLHADETGQRVRKGEPLFTLYSPELYSTQQEFLHALSGDRFTHRTTPVPDRTRHLAEAARRRLRLYGLTESQIDSIAVWDQPLEYVPVLSPVSGTVIEKDIVEGAAVSAGMRLFRIAGLDEVWIEAQLYEADLAVARPGQEVRVTFPNLPGREVAGRIDFLYPTLDETSRSGRARVRVPNPGYDLRPDQTANVEIEVDLGERLAIPASAVIHAGPRAVVFVDLGEGRLRPQDVVLGLRGADHVEVVEGLAPGDVIVVSGNFLIAAESRLKSAAERWQ